MRHIQKIYHWLQVAIGTLMGLFLSLSIYDYFIYSSNPRKFDMKSTHPWYFYIIVLGIVTHILIAIISVIMIHIKKKYHVSN